MYIDIRHTDIHYTYIILYYYSSHTFLFKNFKIILHLTYKDNI